MCVPYINIIICSIRGASEIICIYIHPIIIIIIITIIIHHHTQRYIYSILTYTHAFRHRLKKEFVPVRSRYINLEIAQLVLGSVTTWESWVWNVLPFFGQGFFFFYNLLFFCVPLPAAVCATAALFGLPGARVR